MPKNLRKTPKNSVKLPFWPIISTDLGKIARTGSTQSSPLFVSLVCTVQSILVVSLLYSATLLITLFALWLLLILAMLLLLLLSSSLQLHQFCKIVELLTLKMSSAANSAECIHLTLNKLGAKIKFNISKFKNKNKSALLARVQLTKKEGEAKASTQKRNFSPNVCRTSAT